MHAHLNPWTLVFRPSALVQNDGTQYHHETRDDDNLTFADEAPDMTAARSYDLAAGITSPGARICKSTMVPLVGLEPTLSGKNVGGFRR